MLQNFGQPIENFWPNSGDRKIKIIVFQKVLKLVKSSFQQHQQFINIYTNYQPQNAKKINFEKLKTFFPYLIYAICTGRLLLYAYFIGQQYPLINFDLFISAAYREKIKLDLLLLLSLTGIPVFASVVHYLIENRIGGKSPLAVHLFDAINRNAAQVEEAVGGNQGGYFTVTYRQFFLSFVQTSLRLLRMLVQLYTGNVPLKKPLKSLHFYPQFSVSSRERILFFAAGAECAIRLMHFVLSKLMLFKNVVIFNFIILYYSILCTDIVLHFVPNQVTVVSARPVTRLWYRHLRGGPFS